MYDIDPPSPVLHLSSPQAGRQPTLASNGQALAQHTQSTKPRAHIAEGIADHWARLHTAMTGGDGSPVHNLRALRKADAALARHIDAL